MPNLAKKTVPQHPLPPNSTKTFWTACHRTFSKNVRASRLEQVCNPVGCVPPASVATVNRMTNRCKNITLPQTSFVGSNNGSRNPLITGSNRYFYGHTQLATRLHSSRMRTARLLTVSQHALCRRCLPRGGCLPGGSAQVGCLPGGCVADPLPCEQNDRQV